MNLDTNDLKAIVEELPYPPLFVTVSGAHLYGFPSPDSDVDLRGAFVLPLREVLGLEAPEETISKMWEQEGREMDLVAHDVKKFTCLLLNKNGYVMEQIFSPLVVHTTPAFEELRELARGAITRHVYHHYAGFASSQVRKFKSEEPRRAKTLLYVYRVLLTGIWLLRTGEVEANLVRLNEHFKLPFIPDLIAEKVKERAVLDESTVPHYCGEIARLQTELEQTFESTALPAEPQNRPALNDFLIRARLEMGRD